MSRSADEKAMSAGVSLVQVPTTGGKDPPNRPNLARIAVHYHDTGSAVSLSIWKFPWDRAKNDRTPGRPDGQPGSLGRVGAISGQPRDELGQEGHPDHAGHAAG